VLVVLVGVLCFLAYVVLSFFWAFLVMPYFYDVMPKIIFLTVFFFLSVFVWVIATYISNVATGEETDFEDSVKETIIRTIVGYVMLVALAFLFVFIILME